jgi:hypothetical protein
MAKKKDKQQKKREKRLGKLAESMCPPKGCKSKCCKKYKKCESKRCKKCPCFDLLEHLQKENRLYRVA